MRRKKGFPQESGINAIPAHCWDWPDDDLMPVDLSTYDLSSYSKQGLSQIKAARRLPEDTPVYWKKRKEFPILYLVKYGKHATYLGLVEALNTSKLK